ncbi:MAG: iron-sulfur cluster repair di-iron protein [Actinobacteria bacterium]|nr:iron-sulfur cluster repair di-iron protein [Actinomycetota bacterium]
MIPLEPTASLAELAAERPARARIFERLRLDYCCGGAQTLAAACADRGLDAATVAELLEAIERDGPPADPVEERDWARAPIDELCEHIVSVHHQRLREEMPRIGELTATVARVHGEGRPELEMVERAFAALREELEPHLAEEERDLFPVCRALERQGAAAGLDLATVDRHQAEHEAVGRKLAALRELAGGYQEAEALCSTHLALLTALSEFEADLHRHVHEENNILFPRLRGLIAGGG